MISQTQFEKLLKVDFSNYSFSRQNKLARCDTCTKFEVLGLTRRV